MNGFLKGLVVGAGVSLLVWVSREEWRSSIRQNVSKLGATLPSDEQLHEYKGQIGSRVSQSAGVLKDYAQQAASAVRENAYKAAKEVRNASDEVAHATKETLRNTEE